LSKVKPKKSETTRYGTGRKVWKMFKRLWYSANKCLSGNTVNILPNQQQLAWL
jgi:hypothetical protein